MAGKFSSATKDIFADLKVVELASVLAGPAVGQFFAELGARVLKIENKRTGGDVTRRWKAPGEDPHKTDSAYYRSTNFGKEVTFLDLRDERDREQVYGHVREADLVIVNYRAGAAKKLHMDYETLAEINPSLIYAELSGFGPNDRRPAFDVVLQAETGFIHLTGHSGAPPAKLPVALIDLLAAHQLKEGILIALLQRAQNGVGSKVSTNLYDAAISSLANQATNWLIAGYSPQRLGTQHPNIAPYGDLFETKDQQLVVLAVGVEEHFTRLCDLLDREELARLEAYQTNAARVKNRDSLVAELRPLIAQYDRESFLNACHQKGIPAGAVRDLPDVFAQQATSSLRLQGVDDAGQPVESIRTAVFTIESASQG